MKHRSSFMFVASLLAGAGAGTASADWIDFVDETATRLQAASNLGADDVAEKDYGWGDVDNDGWIDLVVVRKQPFGAAAPRVNVLLMNEQGVLVDRTEQYATASDVAGDDGFLTPTVDRDVRVVDVNNDGWLDLVTATTLSNGQPKHISYPRVYMNLAESPRGDWQGFRFENARIPQMAGDTGGGVPHAPRFCAVAAGDVTGDGYVDLYFGDYDGCAGCESMTFDFNDRLLINDGQGTFSDETSLRIPNSNWLSSNFTTQAMIEDLNGDGVKDIVQVHSLGGYESAIVYNNPSNPGFFNSRQQISNSSPYFAMVGDLNKSGRLDVVLVDDGADRFRINQGNQPNGQVNWSSNNMLSQTGFRSNIVIADLNNDTWPDLLIADVDVDLGNCSGSGVGANIYRHNTNQFDVDFIHDRGNIPFAALDKTWDMAVFDIDGDGWTDIVFGRCGGTNVMMNQPTFGIEFGYPSGRPQLLVPNTPNELVVEMEAYGQSLDPETAMLHVSVNGGPFTTSLMTPQSSGDTFVGTIPPVDCLDTVHFYISGELSGGGVVTDPPLAPKQAFSAVGAEGTFVAFEDDIEGSVAGWTIHSDPSLTGGEWEQAVPVGTICCGGALASPDGDASPNPSGMAFTTENCKPGQFPGSCSVEHGPTYLTSPTIDLAGSNAVITYDRWMFSSNASDPEEGDLLLTQVSNDGGGSWVTVDAVGSTNGTWQAASFLVSDHIAPTANVQVRFVVGDAGNNSITNAGIDNFVVEELDCGEKTSCPGDISGDNVVDVSDLLSLLSAWGACPGCPADLNDDDVVDVSDLLALLSGWGACE